MKFIHKWQQYRKLINLKFYHILILLTMTIVSTFSEMLGLGLFYPIFQYINTDGNLELLTNNSNIWSYILSFIDFIGMEVSLGVLLLFSFTAFLIRQIFMYIKTVYAALINKNLEMQLTNKLFDNYLNADVEYYDSMPIGLLTNIVTRETTVATSAIMIPIELMTHLIMLIGFLTLLLFVSVKMTIIAFLVVGIASLLPRAWINQSEKVGKDLVSTNNILTTFLVERLKSPRLVRLSGTKKAERIEFEDLVNKQRKNYIRATVLTSRTELILEPVVILLSLIFLYFSVTVLKLSVELIGIYLLISMRLMPVVKGVLLLLQSIKTSIGSIEIVNERLKQMQNSKEVDAGNMSLESKNIEVAFDSVSYKYPLSKYFALNSISFSLIANKMNAIVGPSGGGKSTLIDLIPRLRTPSSGLITINNTPIANFSIRSLRKSIAYVPQNPQIFNGSIANHILYGNINATKDDLYLAAKLSGAIDFIDDLPEKFDTLVGEDAINFSGGQRQRLDLARALIQKAPILILDEPTSNLDADAEESFNKTLVKIANKTNTTIVIIAHRLSGISAADQIIVLNKGKVEDTGNHEKLMNSSGWYSSAWRKQMS
jgi:ABC-type multidrug transport system fused ATPase/permease subunit